MRACELKGQASVSEPRMMMFKARKCYWARGPTFLFRSREASIRAEDEAIGGVVEGIVETARQ